MIICVKKETFIKFYLLCISFCEREFSGNVEHNLTSVEGGENCFISCLAMRHIQTSPETEMENDDVLLTGDNTFQSSVLLMLMLILILISKRYE